MARPAPEDDPLLVWSAVAHAVDEDGGPHDGRRQRIAGQQADQHGRPEDPVGERAQVDERIRGAAEDDASLAALATTQMAAATEATGRMARLGLPSHVSASSPAARAVVNRPRRAHRAGHGPGRQPGARRPDDDGATIASGAPR